MLPRYSNPLLIFDLHKIIQVMSKKLLSLFLFSVLLVLIIAQKKPNEQTLFAAVQDSTYLAQGKTHVMALQKVLVGQLVNAISDKGSAGAVDFCQLQAIPLTDSISESEGVSISRVTDRPRNPDNFGDSHELALIDKLKFKKQKGDALTPELRKKQGEVTAYYPIVTNTLCLQCHGSPESQISSETLETLKKHYPDDMATGYSENEVRGLWKVIMKMEE